MTLFELRSTLNKIDELTFCLPSQITLPAHVHLTELGLVSKTYYDCGNRLREERYVSFQLWAADDTDHRLSPKKLQQIISETAKELPLDDLPIRVEYQGQTIETYSLDFNADNNIFLLLPTFTDCLAKEQCGIPKENKTKIQLSELNQPNCQPNSGCC